MKKFGNVYVFFGTDSKVGTTMLTTSVAELLATNSKVLMINANKKNGLDYIGATIDYTGIDELQNKLSSNVLEYEDVSNAIFEVDNIHILAGVKHLERSRHFAVEDINTILELVCDKYDLVIVDAGNDYEYNALAIGALKSTDNTVLVTTQQETSRNEMERVLSISRRLDIQFKHLLVNKEQPKGMGVIEVDAIKSLSNIDNLLGTVPFSPYSWQSEADYTTLIHNDKDYKEKLYEISNEIAKSLGIEELIDESTKKGFKLFGVDIFGK